MKHNNDSMRKYREALKKQYNRGLGDKERGVFQPGLIAGDFLHAYISGFKRYPGKSKTMGWHDDN